jgi:hypothetical protein
MTTPLLQNSTGGGNVDPMQRSVMRKQQLKQQIDQDKLKRKMLETQPKQKPGEMVGGVG